LQKSNESTGASAKHQYFFRIVSNEVEEVLQYFATFIKMRLAGLMFVIGGQLYIHIQPGAGSRCHSFSLCFLGLDLNDAPQNLKRNKNPGLCLRLDHRVKLLFSFNGKPANREWR
jgi:hypothetical protein